LGLKICCKRNKSDRRVEITLPVQHRESKEREKEKKVRGGPGWGETEWEGGKVKKGSGLEREEGERGEPVKKVGGRSGRERRLCPRQLTISGSARSEFLLPPTGWYSDVFSVFLKNIFFFGGRRYFKMIFVTF